MRFTDLTRLTRLARQTKRHNFPVNRRRRNIPFSRLRILVFLTAEIRRR